MAVEQAARGEVTGEVVVYVPDERAKTSRGLVKRYRFLRRRELASWQALQRPPGWMPAQILGVEEVGPAEWPRRRWEREEEPPAPPVSPF